MFLNSELQLLHLNIYYKCVTLYTEAFAFSFNFINKSCTSLQSCNQLQLQRFLNYDHITWTLPELRIQVVILCRFITIATLFTLHSLSHLIHYIKKILIIAPLKLSKVKVFIIIHILYEHYY